LLWYTVSTGGTGSATAPVPSTATAGTTSYYVSQTINGCEGPRAQIDVVVEAPPDISLSLGTTIDPVCIGGISSVTVINSEPGVSYQLRNNADNSLIGTALAGTGANLDLPTGALNSTTTFNVLAIKVGCSLPLTATATVTVLGNIDPSLVVSAQASPICEGSGTNILVDNSVNGVTYQLRDDADDSLVGVAIGGTGGTISLPTGILSTSKVFNILASNGTCSIELSSTVSVNVDINPDPTLAVVAALDPLCVGGSTSITISSSETGVSYQLRNDSDNSLIGTPVAGNGGQLDLPTGVLNATITFNVLATGGVCIPVQLNTKPSVTVSGTINLTLVPTPQINPICSGENANIQIANSEAGVNYQLINDTDDSLIPGVVVGTGGTIDLPTGILNTTTTFRVLASTASCSAELTSTSSVNVTPLPSASLNVTAVSGSVCETTSTVVQVANSEPGIIYQLRNDADDSIVSGAVVGNGTTIDLPTGPITAATTFNVLATNGTCSIELSMTATVTINDAPDKTLSVLAQDPSVCSGTGTVVQVLNTEPGIIYRLRDDADNSAVSGDALGNGGTINLPTGPITADRTFNVFTSNTLCSVQLTSKVTITLKPINDPTCSNCSSVVVATINPTKVTCNAAVPDGSIEFDVQPPVPTVNIIGIKIQISGPTNKTQTDNFVFTGLAAGNYTYTVTYGDENNPDCIKTGTFIIEVTRLPDPVDFDLVINEFNCLTDEGSITLSSVTGASGTDFQYTISSNGSSFSQGVIPSSTSSFNIRDLVTGDYEIQLSQNQQAANGCVGVVSSPLVPFTIAQPAGGCGIIIPNVFTPNGDGANDFFKIRNLPANSSVAITNRWGKEVFSSADYQNNWTAEDIADGVYYFRLVADGEVHTGWVEILR
jgi:gliding motility-associated-like protein